MLESYGNVIYLVVYFAAFFELLLGVWFIFPGAVVVFLISFFWVQNGLRPEMIFLAAFTGGMSGSLFDYYLWRRFWSMVGSWKKQLWKSVFFKSVSTWVHKSLFQSLVLGRFIPGVKEFAPSICGASRVNFNTFLYYAALWNLLWVSIFFWFPYIFSYSLSISTKLVDAVSYFSVVLFVIFMVAAVLQYILIEYGKRSLRLFMRSISVLWDYIWSLWFVRKLRLKYPKIEWWLIRRFSSDLFTGLPLTILVIFFIYLVSAFTGLLEFVFESPASLFLDTNLDLFFQAIRTPLWVDMFLWITSLSRAEVIIGLYLIFSGFLFLYDRKNEIVAFGISIAGATAFALGLKNIFSIDRPLYPIYVEYSFSFPSWHAMMAVLFYWFIAWILIQRTQIWKYKVWITFYALLVIGMIGLSRLYLWVHFLSDVLGGYLIGALWLVFAIWLSEYLNTKKLRHTIKKKASLYTLFLLIWAIVFFVLYVQNNPYERVSVQEVQKSQRVDSIEDVFITDEMRYTQTLIWENAENIHFLFLAESDSTLINAFKSAGWSLWDLYNYESFKKTISNVLFKTPYESAPVTPLFWNNTTQQFAFQFLPDVTNLRERHHIRVWETGKQIRGKNVYVWVWVFDIGLKWNIIHTIDPDINAERDYTLTSLEDAWVVSKVSKIQFVDSYVAKNVFWDDFYSDGILYIVDLQALNEKK